MNSYVIEFCDERTLPWVYYEDELIIGEPGEHHNSLIRRLVILPRISKAKNDEEKEFIKEQIDKSLTKMFKKSCLGRYNPEVNVAFFYYEEHSCVCERLQVGIHEAFESQHPGFHLQPQ